MTVTPTPPARAGVPSPESRQGFLSRRRFLKLAGGAVLASVGGGAYARWIEPTWLEVTETNLGVPGLPTTWEGTRVALVADLHCGATGPSYIETAIDVVNDTSPELVLVAGDLVQSGSPGARRDVAKVLERLAAPRGVFTCLGNHDYGVYRPSRGLQLPRPAVASEMEARGVTVLDSRAVPVEKDGERLWIAGAEDFWTGRFDAAATMSGIPKGAAHLVLCHNPDGAEEMESAGARTILSGHTHGGQVQIPFYGPPVLPVTNRDRYEGLHTVGRARLYITRGIGWLRKVRFGCRPEISVLRLRRA